MLQVIEVILLIIIAWMVVSQRTEGGGWRRLVGRQRKLILDSCALIDGRIVEVVRTGFLADELVIPQFILSELQLLADGNDSHKRERARYGLDVAHELQDTAPMKVVIERTPWPNIQATDDKLVALAKKMGSQLYTTDYNLAKVAAVEGVKVLNINELAQSLRPITLPGETITIKIIQKGSSRDQGVGYLDDGTMIVVDGGARFVGKTVPVVVTRMHQTVAGKMVFGQVKQQAPQHHRDTPAEAPAGSDRAETAQAAQAPSQAPQNASRQRRERLHHRLSKPSMQLRRPKV